MNVAIGVHIIGLSVMGSPSFLKQNKILLLLNIDTKFPDRLFRKFLTISYMDSHGTGDL